MGRTIQTLTFDSGLLSGNIIIGNIGDIPITPVSFTGTSVGTLNALCSALYQADKNISSAFLKDGLTITVLFKSESSVQFLNEWSVTGGSTQPEVGITRVVSNDIQPIDYGALAKSRIAQQYKNLPKFHGRQVCRKHAFHDDSFLRSIGVVADAGIDEDGMPLVSVSGLVEGLAKLIESGLETPCGKLFEILDIDKMEGANLDNIGEIVGQSRDVLTYEALTFFGLIYEMEWDETVAYPLDDTVIDIATNTTYKSLQAANLNHAITDGAWWEAITDPDPTTGSFGDGFDTGVGAVFLSDVGSEFANTKRTMDDVIYRAFIKARILKNYSNGTLGDLIAAIQTLTGAEQVKIDEGVMELDIGVLGTLDENTLNLIKNYDILPRPTGVQINEPYAYSILNFNGATSKVEFGATTDFDIGSDDFEIRFRVKTMEQDAVVLSKEDAVNSTTPSYCAYVEDGVLKFSYSPVDGTEVVAAGAFVADGEAKSCTVKNVSGIVSISVDGEAVSDSENTFEAATGTADFLALGIKKVPDVVTVSDCTEPAFDLDYTYVPATGKWTNGIRDIWKDTLWYMSDGTTTYHAPDNGLNIPPATFYRTLDYPLTIAVVGLSDNDSNGVYAYNFSTPPFGFGNYWKKTSPSLRYIKFTVDRWEIRSTVPFPEGTVYSTVASFDLTKPSKTGWSNSATLEYTLDATATVSFSTASLVDASFLSGILQDLSISIAGTERGHWSMIKTHADVVTDPTTLVDLSGNGNDGTITDPVWQNNLTL